MTDAIEIIEARTNALYGDEVSNPEERLAAFKALTPGDLPENYQTALLWYRREVAFKDNQIESIEPSQPREPGIFQYVGDNPPLNKLYGLQANRANLFKLWRWHYACRRFRPDRRRRQRQPGLPEPQQIRIRPHPPLVPHRRPRPNDARGFPGRHNTFLLAYNFTDLLRRLRPPAPLPNIDISSAKICYYRP